MEHLPEAELVRRIEACDRAYWNGEQPLVSDDEYDLLTRQLAAIDPDHPLLRKVHAPVVVSSGEVRHLKPMLSLDKAYSLEAVLAWARKHSPDQDRLLRVQPKYDGISAIYENGILSTRGDGVFGENISDKLPLITLEAVDYTGPLNRPARGEIVIRKDEFQTKWGEIRKKDGQPYRNPRNATAGILGLDSITMIAFQMERAHTSLTLVDYDKISYDTPISELESAWSGLVAEIESLPYPLDGIVIKFADTVFAESLGETEHHPRGQIAYKFSNVSKESRIVNVKWGCGKNSLTPVAEIEPVQIGGTTISNVTLHNLQNILDNDIEIGDEVTVARAGDVIPFIMETRPGKERRSALIEHCPSCEADVVRRGVELACPNPACPGTLKQRLLAAIRTLDIDDIGESTVENMIRTLNVRSIKDLFFLSVEDLLRLDNTGEIKARKLYNALQSARTLSADQLIAALNIPGIGRSIARKILLEHPLSELRHLPKEAFVNIVGIGPERAERLYTEFHEQSGFLDELLATLNVTAVSAQSVMTICFTGKMPEKRDYYRTLAKMNGYEAVETVGSGLTLLVVADASEHSSKLQKAKSLGVPVMVLDEWISTLENREVVGGSDMIQDEFELF